MNLEHNDKLEHNKLYFCKHSSSGFKFGKLQLGGMDVFLFL